MYIPTILATVFLKIAELLSFFVAATTLKYVTLVIKGTKNELVMSFPQIFLQVAQEREKSVTVRD